MKRGLLYGLCLLFLMAGVAFTQDKMIIFFKDGRTQSIDLGSIQRIEYRIDPSGIDPPPEKGVPVTLYWHMTDNADVYLNGIPLRRYEPSFRTRPDETPQPPFSASAVIKNGDVFTVGGRRGGSYGFMLIAVDSSDRVIFKTDPHSWRVYMPGERSDWYLPSVAMSSATIPVTVQPNPWPPQRELNQKYANIASSIWGSPSERFSYLMATVKLTDYQTGPVGRDILPRPAGLVSWWPGDGNPNDVVGNRHGTLKGGTSYGHGIFGQAFKLDGVDDFVDLGTWNLGAFWTLEAWVNPSSTPTGRRTIAGGISECRDWGLTMHNRELGVAIRQPGGCTQTISSGILAVPGTWYHIVGVSDGSTARVYINGELKKSGTVEANYTGTSQGTRIGGEVCCSGNNFPGLIDEVRFYNRALSAQEIATNFNASRTAMIDLSVPGPGQPPGNIVNLALKKPAIQSSIYTETGIDQGPHLGVDGILKPHPRDPYLMVHTNADHPSWWQVDLQNVYELTELKLFNRTACCGERARTLQVLLSRDGVNWERAYGHGGSNFEVLTVNLQGKTARYVKLQLTERNWLHFYECEVYGYSTPISR